MYVVNTKDEAVSAPVPGAASLFQQMSRPPPSINLLMNRPPPSIQEQSGGVSPPRGVSPPPMSDVSPPKVILDENPLENDLVVQSLNYHGQKLTNFMQDLPEFCNLKLNNVDYNLYRSRSKELRVEEQGRRMLLHRFIAQNCSTIFRFAYILTDVFFYKYVLLSIAASPLNFRVFFIKTMYVMNLSFP